LLAQFLTVGIQYDWGVQVSWLRCTQHPLHMDLPRSGIEQVGAADHIRDTLLGVIDHYGQLIGVGAIRTQSDKVTAVVVDVLTLQPLYSILEAY
jgi:hypothetical protein